MAWAVAAIAGLGSAALAQPTGDAPAAPDPDPAAAKPAVTTAPAVRFLPALELPPDAGPLPDTLTVTVRVDAGGGAVIDDTSLPPGPLRDAVSASLAAGRFTPATVDGEATVALTMLRFSLAPPAPEAGADDGAPATEAEDGGGDDGSAVGPAAVVTASGAYGARTEVDPTRPTARKLKLREVRDVPGTFGDPFRVVATLPGVVPVFSGLPYVYVRGSPPAGTGYFYDGIAVPALFHLALGPAVIHPAMIGDLEFYPAIPPARYGRRVGGLFGADGRHAGHHPDGGVGGELEIRLIDAQGMLDVEDEDTRVTAAGRYGYPGILVSAIEPRVVLDYWDYQLRATHRLNTLDRAELVVFGSYDLAGDRDDRNSQLNLQFHRAELRLIRAVGNVEFGSALQLGYERSSLGDAFSVTAARIGPRAWWKQRIGPRLRLFAGADMLASRGELRDRSGDSMDDEPVATDPGTPTDFMAEEDDGPQVADARFASASTRNVMGAHAELQIDLTDAWLLQPGVRADLWLSGTHAEGAVDPRLMTSYAFSDTLRAHLAGGMGHQSTPPPIPLPATNDVVLEPGLQRAIKGEAGVAWEPWHALLVETSAFYNHMDDILLFPLDCEGVPEGPLQQECDRLLPRGTLDAYGMELFLKRPMGRDRLSGWLSYTLGWVEGRAAGLRFTPNADVRHIGNLVMQYRLSEGWSCGLRFFGRTGKPVRTGEGSTSTPDPGADAYPGTQRRLPGFYRGDAEVSYRWRTGFGSMRLKLEWMNFTLSREPVSECSDDAVQGGQSSRRCGVSYAPIITIPNIGLRGEF